jgi:hypothetical protein
VAKATPPRTAAAVSQSSSLQPALHRWWLNTQRAQAFRNLEKRRQSRVIGLILHTPGGLVLGRDPDRRRTAVTPSESHRVRAPLRHERRHPPGGLLGRDRHAPHAALGPVDPQLGQHAAASVAQSQEVRQWRS